VRAWITTSGYRVLGTTPKRRLMQTGGYQRIARNQSNSTPS
jgi:hypothetical protein